MLFENIKKLVQYGIDTGLTPEFMMRQLNLKQFWQGYLMRHVKGELLKTALCTETCLTQRL